MHIFRADLFSRVTYVTVEPDKLQVRRAAIDDLGVIEAITDMAYAKYVSRIGRKPRPMTADYAAMMADHAMWLLEQGNTPLGVLVVQHESDHLLIYSVAIAPEHQKRGYGRMLLSWAEQHGQANGYPEIRLYTNALFEENIRLYLRLGYQECRREALPDGGVIVHMYKTITE